MKIYDVKEKGCNHFNFLNETITPKEAIIMNCLDCGGYEKDNYYNCSNIHCPFITFNHKYVKASIKQPKELTDEEKEVIRKRFIMNMNKKTLNS